jgi:hypothetical protein
MTRPALTPFLRGYADCVLFTGTDETDESGANPLDDSHTVDDITDETLTRMARDCERFQRDNETDLAEYYRLRSEQLRPGEASAEEHAGHDFWLTRNGHGTGFWDREVGPVGERLTEACKQFGEEWVYLGDDGTIDGH